MKIDSHITMKSGKKSCNYNLNPKSFRRSRDRCQLKKMNECVPLDSSVFGRSKNFTLDFTSSNSTPSERTFVANHTASMADTVTERIIESKPMNEKVFSTMSTRKPQRIFCKDPNKRLKNLFTIIQPNEKCNENASFTKCHDVELLNKTKELLVNLIDKELQKVEPDVPTKNSKPQLDNCVIDNSVLKKLKLECVRKIEDELRLMKRLENL